MTLHQLLGYNCSGLVSLSSWAFILVSENKRNSRSCVAVWKSAESFCLKFDNYFTEYCMVSAHSHKKFPTSYVAEQYRISAFKPSYSVKSNWIRHSCREKMRALHASAAVFSRSWVFNSTNRYQSNMINYFIPCASCHHYKDGGMIYLWYCASSNN